LRQVKKKANKLEPVEVWEEEKGVEKVEVSTFIMDNVLQSPRFLKFAIKYPKNVLK